MQTDVGLVYRHEFTYRVTAGVGLSNATMVASYTEELQDAEPGYSLKVMPYSTQALVYDLVSNPVHAISVSPVACPDGTECQSYFLNGGLYLTAPWPPTNYSSTPVVQLDNVIGRQLDFQVGITGNGKFSSSDCSVYTGNNTDVAMEFCSGEAQSSTESFIAALYVCTKGVVTGTCAQRDAVPQINSTISLYKRTSAMVVSRTNSSIVSLSDLGQATLDPQPNMAGFKEAIDWLLDWESAGVPVTSSIAAMFWDAQDQLSNQYWDSEPSTAFQSIIAYPFCLFHNSNFGNVDLPVHDIDPNLPSKFSTTASLAVPLSKILISNAEFIAFVLLEGTTLLFSWGAIAWIFRSSVGKRDQQGGTTHYNLL